MQLNKTLQWLIIGGLFLVPFIAFTVSYSMFFPFIVGKNFFFRILIEILFACWLFLCTRDRTYWPQRSWIMYAASAFLIILAVADIFGANVSRSFWSNYERMEGLVTHIHLFAYFVILGSILGTAQLRVKSERLWYYLLHTTIGASLLMSLYALLQVSGKIAIDQGSTRVDGTLGNAAYMAIYLVFHIFFLAYVALEPKTTKVMRSVYGAVALFEVIMLYFTATRGAIIGLVLGVIVVAIIYLLKEKDAVRGRMVAKSFLGVVVVVILLFLGLQRTSLVQSSPVLSRFTLESILQTINTRSAIWHMAYEGWQEHPLLGWGQDNYNLIFNKYYKPSLYGQEQWFDRAHNVFFDWLTAAGILGLLAYLALYAAGMYGLWKARGEEISSVGKAILIGLFVAYFVHNFTVFDNLVSYILFFTLLAYIHTYTAITTALEKIPHKSSPLGAYSYPAGVAIVVIMLYVLYTANVPAIEANRTLLQAIDPRAGGEQQLTSFTAALALDTFGNGETREQLVQEAIRQFRNDKTAQVTKEQFTLLAESEMKKQIATAPDDARYHVFLGGFYNQLGQLDLGIRELQQALALSPNKQSIMLELGNAYLNTKDFPHTLEYLEKAYTLDRRNEDALFIYAAGLIYAGKNAEADALLTQKFGTTKVFQNVLVNAYAATKQYGRLTALWQARIAKDPTNGQLYVSLAASYLAAGERQNAIAQLEKAVAVNPQFKKQGEYYIKEIQAGRNP